MLARHLAACRLVAPQGAAHLAPLKAALEEAGPSLPTAVAEPGRARPSQIEALERRIDALSIRLRAGARRDETARRPMTIPSVGTDCAVAPAARAAPVGSFSMRRDAAARIGLVPRQKSSGGKSRLGHSAKLGQRDRRRRPLATGGHPHPDPARQRERQPGLAVRHRLRRFTISDASDRENARIGLLLSGVRRPWIVNREP